MLVNSLIVAMLSLQYRLVFIVSQKTAYGMRISVWSSAVCSSDLRAGDVELGRVRAQSRHDDLRCARLDRSDDARKPALTAAQNEDRLADLQFAMREEPVIACRERVEEQCVFDREAVRNGI